MHNKTDCSVNKWNINTLDCTFGNNYFKPTSNRRQSETTLELGLLTSGHLSLQPEISTSVSVGTLFQIYKLPQLD
jgi:hypothetical protein